MNRPPMSATPVHPHVGIGLGPSQHMNPPTMPPTNRPVGSGQANPLQPIYAPPPTQGNATLFQGAQLGDPSSLGQLGQFLSPQSTIQQILQGFAPQAAQAQNGLNSQLSALGISGGAGINAQDQLQQQLAQALGPTLAGAIQNSQANTLGALGQNAGLTQQAGLSNQNAMNQFTGQNLQNWNNWDMYNNGLANNANMNLAQMLQNAYGQNLNAFQNINMAGLGGQQSLANTGLGNAGNLAGYEANNFPVMSSPFSGLGTALGSAFGGYSGQNPTPPGTYDPYGGGAGSGYNGNGFGPGVS